MRPALTSIVCALGLFSAALGRAAENPAVPAVEAVVRHQAEAFSRLDAAAVKADWAPGGSIIDEFPPYFWQGSAPFDLWWATFQELAAKDKITNMVAKIRGFQRVMVTGDRAYTVAEVGITFKMDGKGYKQSGLWTFVLGSVGGSWKVTAWGWSGQPIKSVK